MADTAPNAHTHLAKQVARLQTERGLSIEELAGRASIDRAELERILRAEAEVGADVILLLSAALGVEPGELLNGIAWVRDGKGGGEYRVDDPEGG
jgi:transcriptional regulator with XRE-family HTH domain